MEEALTTPTEQEEKMSLTKNAITYLTETRKWTYFLSIVGFIFVGIMVLIGLVMGPIFNNLPMGDNPMPFPGGVITVLYIAMALVYFFPVYYLYQFSVKMKTALVQKSEVYLESAFRFLKSNFKFMGILTIVMLALYPIIIIVAIIFGVMSGMH